MIYVVNINVLTLHTGNVRHSVKRPAGSDVHSQYICPLLPLAYMADLRGYKELCIMKSYDTTEKKVRPKSVVQMFILVYILDQLRFFYKREKS